MNNPTVSILMPAYNVEKYVAEAIDCIFAQTFEDFELLVLDDCSTDNTEEIVRSYSDKRIRHIRHKQNMGLANNLNVGLKLARGRYIARMDGDDISLPERLQTQIDFLEAHPDIDLCSCGLQMFGMEDTVWIRESDPEDVKITMMFYSPILHATSVWRRESFEKHNLYYNQDMFPAEDYDLWSRAVFHCKLANIPQVLYKYRIHGIQVTKTDDRVVLRDREIKLNYLKSTLPSLNIENRTHFVDLFCINADKTPEQINKLKIVYKQVLIANNQDHFFRQSLLARRLRRYYQSIIFNYLKTNKINVVNIKLLFDLRVKQIVKLITNS